MAAANNIDLIGRQRDEHEKERHPLLGTEEVRRGKVCWATNIDF